MRVTDDDIMLLARKLVSLAAERGPRDLALTRARLEAAFQTFSACAVGDIEESVAKTLRGAVQDLFDE